MGVKAHRYKEELSNTVLSLRYFKLSREIEMACFIGTSYVIRHHP